MKKLLKISIIAIMLSSSAFAASDGKNELSKKNTQTEIEIKDCFEPLNRATFAFNQGLDKVIFKPVAKSYRVLPSPLRTGTGNEAKILFYCESSNAHAQTLQAAPHSAGSSATLVLPTASGTLIGTGDTGTLPLAAIDIDGGADIGAALTTTDLIVVDDGAGGTNRKAALSRMVTLMAGQLDDPTALSIALG